MKLSVDVVAPAIVIVAVIAVVVMAAITIPEVRKQRREFDAACKLHDGIVYRTRDGSICLKKDSVITNL